MVVTRRQSASPMPAVPSRTSSSTGSRSSNKGKGIDKSSPLKEAVAGPSHVPLNGTPLKPAPPPVGPRHVEDIRFDDDPPIVTPKPTPAKSPTKSKSKPKPKPKKQAKLKKRHAKTGISAFDILARLFLLWLTIYTLSVCPEDTQLRSPVCRALTEYRRVILEPYIYPPIRAALDHPAVAPHIQRVQPYYNRAVQVSTPWVRRGKQEWRHRVVPQIQWLQLRARPSVLRAERQYDATVGPYVQQASDAAARFRLQAEPYVLAAALKSHQSWNTAKPYLVPVWQEAKRVPGIVAVYVGRPLGDARRQWVDPQVIKIWDAVVEQGRADTQVVHADSIKVTSFVSASSTPVSSLSSTSLATSTVGIEDVTPTPAVPIPEPTDEAATSASSIIVESASVTASSVTDDSVAEPSVSSVAAPMPSSVVSVHQPSSVPESIAAPPLPEQTDGAAASAASIIRETEGLSPSSSSQQVPISSDRAALPFEAENDVDVEDLDAFLSDLDDDPLPKVEEPPQPVEETEEQRVERLRLEEIQTAEIRADIEARHTQWEIDLDKFGKSQSEVVRSALKTMREAASEAARVPGGPVRGPIEALFQEAEKSLKSMKAYARKLAGEDKSEAEKIKAWETVVDKVDKKFGERVDSSADAVRAWWDAYNQQETLEISQISVQVRTFAERAQDDLGFDYTWLKGVTYQDWQRYHGLVRASKNFAAMYTAIQNGTAPDSPPNPVSEIMEATQEEVDDMILGFETNLGRAKTAAIDSFSSTKSDVKAASSARNVPSGAAEGSEAPAAPVTASGSNSVPEVSILPIDPSGANREVEIPPVILSRGAEEVESAVSRAEEAKTKAAHTEL